MMKKLIVAILVGTSIFALSCGAEKETVKEEVVVKEELKISSSTVAATQVMDRLGLDLVGVPKTSTKLPEKYKDVQEVGQAFSPNFEVIASLTPDLLVFDSSFKDKVEEQVKQYGMNAFYFNTATFGDFKNSVIELGKITSKEEEAQKLDKELQSSVDNVLEKGKKSNKDVKVAILFGTSESYMLATDKSYVGDLLNTIGVKNITDELDSIDSAYVNYSMEQVLELNPDYVLRLAHGDIEESKKAFNAEFEKNPAWKSLDATKEGKVYDLDPTLFAVTANLGVKDAVTELGNIIYGE